MGIKRWGDFSEKETNEKVKTFSGKKKAETEEKVKAQRSQVSASSEYADEVNQNIMKKNVRMGTKKKERKYKTTKESEIIKDKSIYPPDTEDRSTANMSEKVEIYGKLAKFPEGVRASKAFNWVYNLKDPKLSRKDIWYIMVEKQDNELQMIKYQQKQGVNLTKFIIDLKEYYIEKYKSNEKITELVKKIKLGGDQDGNVSSITNIPNIKVGEGKKMIHKIMEDLVRLLG